MSKIQEIKELSKKNMWEAINSLKGQYKSYVYANGQLDIDRTKEVGELVVYLEGAITSKDYIPYIKDLINEFSDGIISGTVNLNNKDREGLIITLPFEIRYMVLTKLKNKIPVEELKLLAKNSMGNFFGFENLEQYKSSKIFSVGEKMRDALEDSIKGTLKDLVEMEKELTRPYEDIVMKIDEEQKYYKEHKKIPPWVLEEMKKFEYERKNSKQNKPKEAIQARKEKKLNIRNLEQILKDSDKKQVDQVLSQKPDIKTPKEVVRYDKDLSEVTEKKGVSIEGISIPEEEVVSEKTPVFDNAIKIPQEPEKQEKPQTGEKVHYDQSEIIKKIKEQAKGKSSIDSKVE